MGTVATTRAARPSDPELARVRATSRVVEVARIRAHFDSVLTELPARDLAALTPAQRERRLAATGLTLAEAARIQVPYVESWDESPAAVATRRPVYTAGSALAFGGSVAMTAWNAHSNARGAGRVRSVLGAAAGAAAIGMGAAGLGMQDVPPAIGVANAAAGAASLWIATRGIVRHRHDLAAARARDASLAQRAVVTPLLPVGRDAGTGVSVALSF